MSPYEVSGGWLTRIIMGRVHTQNNCLIIIEGETGSGKSCLGLSLCEKWDPWFSAKRIAFSGKEFLDLLPEVPNKGWTLWDEVGVYLSHRRWQSEINIEIMQVIQSFRDKFINCIFTVPSASYVDKVVREMCHFVIRMVRRGHGSVYRIVKSPFEGYTFTPYLGAVHSEMPRAGLYDEFRRMHREHLETLYEQSRKQMEAREKKQEERLQKTLQTKITPQEKIRLAKAVLPQIVDMKRTTDQGLVNVNKLINAMREAGVKVGFPSEAYRLRDELLPFARKLRDQANE